MSTPQDQLRLNGLPKDDVSSYPASVADVQRYADAQAALTQFQAPVFVHAGNSHEYLYVACFDGTGNDKNKDPLHETNVSKASNAIGPPGKLPYHRRPPRSLVHMPSCSIQARIGSHV